MIIVKATLRVHGTDDDQVDRVLREIAALPGVFGVVEQEREVAR